MAHASDHAVAGTHQEQHGLTIQQYLIIGLGLTVITVVELGLSYSPLPSWLLIALLVFLSAVKFAIVATYFMQLLQRTREPALPRMSDDWLRTHDRDAGHSDEWGGFSW